MSTTERLLPLENLVSADDWSWALKARRVAREVIRPVIDQDFEARHFRHEVVPALAAEGLLGLHINGYGCAGAGPVAYGLVCQEIEAVDSGWRTFLSVQGSLAMSAIAKFGSEEQKNEYLPRMAAGEAIGCFALTEPAGGSDPAAMTTTAVRDGDDWLITGTKRWIGLANLADVAVVWARTDEGVRGFIVPTDTPGYTATPIENKFAMRASVQCEIEFDNVRVPESLRLPAAEGLKAPFGCLNEARFGIAWGVTGVIRDCIDVATEYSQNRMLFGEPLAGKQITQDKLARMFISYETSVLLALHLAGLKAKGAVDPVQISVAKYNNTRAAIDAARVTREILGGDGVTSDYPVMRHMANLEAVRTYEGTDEVHSLIIGRALTGLSAF
jgi:glutaryl-CoA dehydrogenase